MEFGISLPQFGPANAAGISRCAQQAEDLGFADAWVADHVGVPADAPYPPSFLLDPLTTLTFAAAVTERIGLGTSVLVAPLRHPLPVAKQLATLDVLSGGRLILGVGAGWLKGEFDACGVPFRERGIRTAEAIDVFRACWAASPASFEGPTVRFRDLKIQPLPNRHIPIWVGGHSPPALRRAIDKGDGWQGTLIEPSDVPSVVKQLRAERPEDEFTLSLRLNFDGSDDLDELARQLDSFAEAGIQHVLTNPRQKDLDGWLRSVDALWRVFEPYQPRRRGE